MSFLLSRKHLSNLSLGFLSCVHTLSNKSRSTVDSKKSCLLYFFFHIEKKGDFYPVDRRVRLCVDKALRMIPQEKYAFTRGGLKYVLLPIPCFNFSLNSATFSTVSCLPFSISAFSWCLLHSFIFLTFLHISSIPVTNSLIFIYIVFLALSLFLLLLPFLLCPSAFSSPSPLFLFSFKFIRRREVNYFFIFLCHKLTFFVLPIIRE